MTPSKKNRSAKTDVLQAFIKLRAPRGDDCEEDVVFVGDGGLLLLATRTMRQAYVYAHTHTNIHTSTHTHIHAHICVLTEAALPSLVDKDSCSDSMLTASSWDRRSLACIMIDNARYTVRGFRVIDRTPGISS